jgi:large subunit ribosomal protein L25
MAGGDLRLNNRKLKVRALPKHLPDFIEADITPLDMGNKLYVTKVPTQTSKSCTQHSVIKSRKFHVQL